jgi:hypothetical protein
MTSSLTVADARAALQKYISSTSEEDAFAEFLPQLNMAMERIIGAGKWTGMVQKVAFNASERDYITLPQEAESLLGILVNRNNYSLQGQYYEYLVSGPGGIPDPPPDNGYLLDLGSNFCTLVDMPSAGLVRLKTTSNEDVGKTLTIYGLNNGTPVYNSEGNKGETLTLAATNSSVTSTLTFAQLTSIAKQATVGSVEIYSVVGSTETLLSTFSPGEVNPIYRRYQLRQQDADTTVVGLVKLRFVPRTQETDPVLPNNIGALKFALIALSLEDANDLPSAATHWSACYSLLNQQGKQNRGANRYPLNLKLFPGGRGSVPSTI